jgi:CBS-domain-containing membrane protein
VAADVAGPIETVTLTDTLLEATRRMGVRGAPVLPVLAPTGHRLVGIVSRSHILAAYERALSGSAPNPVHHSGTPDGRVS